MSFCLRFFIIILTGAVLLGSGCNTPGTAQFALGQRQLDNDWEPVDDPTRVGFHVSLQQPEWPVQVEFGIDGAGDNETQTESGIELEADLVISEIFAGVRFDHQMPETDFHLFASGGLSILRAAVDLEARAGPFTFSDDDDDTSVAIYLHTGVFYQFPGGFNIGADLRYTAGSDLTLFDEDMDADGLQFGILLGWNFGQGQRF
jgi:hypothetical protein